MSACEVEEVEQVATWQGAKAGPSWAPSPQTTVLGGTAQPTSVF